MQYKIIQGETPAIIEKEANSLMDDGWTAEGGLAFYMGVIYQVMIKSS